MKKLPISIISPVLNCLTECETHAAYLNRLADLVEEIIIVDSHSDDGTTQRLQELLKGENIRFLQHPRGLYQSWNYGVQSATQPYLTFATVGDELELTSLGYLHETITKFGVDVVISSPQILVAGEPISSIWPPGKIIQALAIEKPIELPKIVSALLLILFNPGGMLGSSASNIYQTSSLQRHPFPLEYGHRGDIAWGFLFAKDIRWAIDPRAKSIFNQVLEKPFATKETPRLIDNMTKTIHRYLDDLEVQPELALLDSQFWINARALIESDNKLLKLKAKRPHKLQKLLSPSYVYQKLLFEKKRKTLKQAGLDFARQHLL